MALRRLFRNKIKEDIEGELTQARLCLNQDNPFHHGAGIHFMSAFELGIEKDLSLLEKAVDAFTQSHSFPRDPAAYSELSGIGLQEADTTLSKLEKAYTLLGRTKELQSIKERQKLIKPLLDQHRARRVKEAEERRKHAEEEKSKRQKVPVRPDLVSIEEGEKVRILACTLCYDIF